MTTITSMGIGTNTDKPDEGTIRGLQLPVACGVWFTSTGYTIPKLIKYKDEQGLLHTLSTFRVLYQEKKFFCGIPTIEYHCELTTTNHIIPFCLLFHVEKQEWKLWWKTQP